LNKYYFPVHAAGPVEVRGSSGGPVAVKGTLPAHHETFLKPHEAGYFNTHLAKLIHIRELESREFFS